MQGILEGHDDDLGFLSSEPVFSQADINEKIVTSDREKNQEEDLVEVSDSAQKSDKTQKAKPKPKSRKPRAPKVVSKSSDEVKPLPSYACRPGPKVDGTSGSGRHTAAIFPEDVHDALKIRVATLNMDLAKAGVDGKVTMSSLIVDIVRNALIEEEV